MFSVARRPGKDLCYLRVGETFAVKGGTQIWEQEIRKIIIDMFRQEFNTEPSPRQCSEMLDSFHGRIKKWNSNEVDMLGLTYTTLDLTSVRTLNIRREDVKTCFKAALDGPIDAAKEKIAEACSMSEGNVKVVVSGGSGKNSVLQAFVRQACKDEGISHPYFFYENAGAHE
ncbi:hypothetical protein KHU50_006115 [Colletotrichum sp. SAR 10_65]|nr:hypothetical protein KHU50_006115 [Colletotrichum sp. SAR 10_65]KAI8192517.1 hypothetical protein K4K51_000001 [Colletotrichum sp. SAR 10_75]